MTLERRAPGGSSSSTALKALRVLEAVAAEPRALALGEVAERAEMHKSAAHRMLATLMTAGYVRQDPGTRRYSLSYRVVSLSRNLLADNEVVRLARDDPGALRRGDRGERPPGHAGRHGDGAGAARQG